MKFIGIFLHYAVMLENNVKVWKLKFFANRENRLK